MAHKVYEDTVLAQGPGANYVKRPKLAAIVGAFAEPTRVDRGIAAAAEALPELKSKNCETAEGKAKYLRSYLSQLITAEALTIVEPGTAPEPAAKAEGGEEKPKRSRKKKEKAEESTAADPAEGGEPAEEPAEG